MKFHVSRLATRRDFSCVLFSSSLFLIYERVISLRMFVNSFVFSSFSSVKNYADLILMRLDSEFIAQKKIHKKRGAYTHSYSPVPSYVQLDYYYSLLSLYVHPLGEQPTGLKNVSKKEELLLVDSRLPSVCPENITHTVCIIMIFRMDIYTYWKKKETESRVSIREHLSYVYVRCQFMDIQHFSYDFLFSFC